jgi:general secretion pathway protein M
MNIRDRFDQLEPREQRLVLIFGGVLGTFLILLVPILLSATLSSRRGENAAIREVMVAISDARATLDRQDVEKQKILARYGKPAPALAGFIEQQATANGIQIPESQDRPVVPHGKRYDERSTKVVLQKVGMKNLATFLEAIVNAGYPARISNINVHRRGMDPDAYDVTVVVSAFDRKEAEKKSAAGAEPSAEASASAP